MRRIIATATTFSLALMPALAFAQNATAQQGIVGTLRIFSLLFNGLIGLFVTVAIVVFFWGLIRYLWEVGEKKHEGLQTMFWGVIAIFVMVSIWGIIHLLQNTFGVQNGSAINVAVPTVNANATVNSFGQF